MRHTRTDIKAPHVLETPSVIAAAKYPRHVVSEGDGVSAKAVRGERSPDGSFTPIHHGRGRRVNVQHIWKMRHRAEAGDRVGPWGAR